MASLKKAYVPLHFRLFVEAVVATELNKEAEGALASLDTAIEKYPEDGNMRVRRRPCLRSCFQGGRPARSRRDAAARRVHSSC